MNKPRDPVVWATEVERIIAERAELLTLLREGVNRYRGIEDYSLTPEDAEWRNQARALLARIDGGS